ncbi:MAG: hypothetical protein NC453_16635 [Muribaculum sp.]|nr:hypothetical protein [Muribaculum sp.]
MDPCLETSSDKVADLDCGLVCAKLILNAFRLDVVLYLFDEYRPLEPAVRPHCAAWKPVAY